MGSTKSSQKQAEPTAEPVAEDKTGKLGTKGEGGVDAPIDYSGEQEYYLNPNQNLQNNINTNEGTAYLGYGPGGNYG